MSREFKIGVALVQTSASPPIDGVQPLENILVQVANIKVPVRSVKHDRSVIGREAERSCAERNV
jgi:hypothetical protein